ncbi:Tubulin polyglutamylase TTLL5 [Tetrabaena socialis]|uniref:Tubulin--tyrosine ligase-like protein 5 n=1 Tax=Tetrabaena socialis TaxID=47790 RepID=A0A2J8AF88_9CHLO|nr:Tubulin polyglutamylase TTLL5 [Tetrabaena socialis]|eukprot:PNH11180.1 Tubulin polyglutamylase TTLL5 [Tetrabaena socialis]
MARVRAFSSEGSAALVERALREAGGVRAGGPPKLDAATGAKQSDGVYGYMHMDSWDLLWSVTAKAALAADLLRTQQMLSIIPGLLAVSRKTTLVRSLRDTFGEAAWGIVPRSFKLPDELDDWGAWVARNPSRDTGLWMLKNNKQASGGWGVVEVATEEGRGRRMPPTAALHRRARGTGLRLVRTAEAFSACFEAVSRPDLPPGMRLYRWYLAQQYVTTPMLIDERKFGVRLWVLVPDVAPLRIFVHTRGLVLFSSHRYDAEQLSGDPDGGPPPGHVTNYAQNENGDVWSLAQLAAHLGQAAWGKLWHAMCRSTAAAFAAALPRCAEVMATVAPPSHSCFQFFGLDFLVDATGRPWLLEVNATPSMKVEHSDPATAALILSQKWPATRDMVALLGLGAERFDLAAAGRSPDRSSPAYAEEELHRRGGFVPLLHLFPSPPASSTPEAAAGAGLLRPLPWSREDRALREWCRASRAYQQAAAEVPVAAGL